MSKTRLARRALKTSYWLGRRRERYALNTARKKTAAKAFLGGALGSWAGTYSYDKLKTKKLTNL